MKRSRFSDVQIIGVPKEQLPPFQSPACTASMGSATP